MCRPVQTLIRSSKSMSVNHPKNVNNPYQGHFKSQEQRPVSELADFLSQFCTNCKQANHYFSGIAFSLTYGH